MGSPPRGSAKLQRLKDRAFRKVTCSSRLSLAATSKSEMASPAAL
jgi:hypothetical protein